jgi:uncharacterized protein (DUF1778 family)
MPVTGPKSRSAQRVERLEARVSRQTKALCLEAARLQGRTLTDFVVHTVVEAANRTVRENEFLELTYRDRIAFVEALLNPPAPNERLRDAMARHSQTVVS